MEQVVKNEDLEVGTKPVVVVQVDIIKTIVEQPEV